eukprot:42857-Hanusia_phi.AAC.2
MEGNTSNLLLLLPPYLLLPPSPSLVLLLVLPPPPPPPPPPPQFRGRFISSGLSGHSTRKSTATTCSEVKQIPARAVCCLSLNVSQSQKLVMIVLGLRSTCPSYPEKTGKQGARSREEEGGWGGEGEKRRDGRRQRDQEGRIIEEQLIDSNMYMKTS